MSDTVIGIRHISEFRPSGRLENPEIAARFGFEELFLSRKIGIESRPIAGDDEFASDLACAAVKKLVDESGLSLDAIDCLVVVTQTPDRLLPNVASVVHGKLGLPPHVAGFDINLGCSGFVYGLSAIVGFMAANGLSNGVLVTAETYSKIMDPEDRNTIPLFGDAATATWITDDDPQYAIGMGGFGTEGAGESVVYHSGKVGADGVLVMDGREIFNFMMRSVPGALDDCLAKNGLKREDVGLWAFHQASRFMLESLIKRLGIDKETAPIDVVESGNTVSSTIPYVLSRHVFAAAAQDRPDVMVICGFGVGLSWGVNVLRKI